MANVLVHSFVYNTYTYNVFVDDVNLAVFCETDDPNPARAVTESDLGAVVGEVFYSFCQGTTGYDVEARLTFPFGRLAVELNRPACGFNPVDCTLTVSIADKTDETEPGACDGAVTALAATGTEPYLYSLDGAFYQESPVFTDLHPDSYTLYAKDQNNCVASIGFTIVAAAPVVEPAYPWAFKPCHWFRLNGVLIEEPIKWDSVNIQGVRSKEYHGWNYQFTDEVVDLEFDCDSGLDIIKQSYFAEGADAEVVLTYGYKYQDTEYLMFEGKLNLNTLKLHPHKAACAVERKDGNDLFETRQDTKVSLGATTTIDGADLTPPPPISFVLHGKEIKRGFRMNNTTTAYGDPFVGNGGTFYTQIRTDNPELNEIEDSFLYPIIHTQTSPVSDNKFVFDLRFGGTYQIRVRLNLRFSYYKSSVTAPANGTSTVILNVNGVETVVGSPVSAPVQIPNVIFALNVDQTLNLTLNATDKVYLYVKHTFSNNSTVGLFGWEDQNLFEVSALEKAADTPCKGWFVFDVLNHVTKSITNLGSRVRSSFFRLIPSAGEGAFNVLTNGFQIRQYEVDKRPLEITAKTLLESLKAIYNIGIQYDNKLIRIERMDFFYQDRQIYFIPEVSDLYKQVAREYLYNEVEIGYEKFQEEGYNTLDEFNTRHEYATPVQTNKQRLLAMSKLIASGYSIESSRRQQFRDTSTNSFQNDDQPFIIAMKRGGNVYSPEKNESFENVENLISPTSAYNLRLSPKRMLYNWANWLKSAFHYKDSTASIRNTFVAQNREMLTDLIEGDTRPVGDTNKAPLTEGADVVLSDYPGIDLYIPEWIRFKCRLRPDVVDMINKSLKGKYSEEKDYGYIMYNDPIDGFVSGWVYELNYNFYTEKAEFLLLRRKP